MLAVQFLMNQHPVSFSLQTHQPVTLPGAGDSNQTPESCSKAFKTNKQTGKKTPPY